MYRALIVDDEPQILEGLKHLIKWDEHGIEIIGSASNGLEALKIVHKTNVQILLTDIKMPLMDGLTLIKNIKKDGLQIKTIILSGYNDFSYVKEGITLGIENYLLKPINKEELSASLVNITEKIESELYNKISAREDINILKNNILYRWLTNAVSAPELKERASFMDIDLNRNYFAVSIVKILLNANIKNEFHNNFALLSFAVNNICNEIISTSNYGITFCDMFGDVNIIFTSDNISMSEIKGLMNDCIDNCKRHLGVDLFITVGSIVNVFDHVYQSYSHALELQEYRLIKASNTIMFYEDVVKINTDIQREIQIDYKEIKQYITNKDEKAAFEFIDRIFAIMFKTGGLTPVFIQNVAMEILININSSIKDLSTSENENILKLKELSYNVMKAKTFEELRDYLSQCVMIAVNILNQKKEFENPTVALIISFINNNYASELSLKTLSQTFKINAAYLGQLFKNETGKLFSDYLNQIRIDLAKELLKNTSMKTNEIAEKVGYTDTNYFYRIFRKITGVSPSDFKNSI